ATARSSPSRRRPSAARRRTPAAQASRNARKMAAWHCPARRRATLAGSMATGTGDLDGALARARSGDEVGFLELWQSLQPRLLRYLRVLSCDDPDDVASETCCRWSATCAH